MANKDQESRMREGYISFNPQELLDEAKENPVNGAAYELLYKAATTSSNVSKKKGKKKIKIDDVYPVSHEETEQMRSLIAEAVAEAGDPDEPKFAGYVSELQGIINFSSRRWNTSQWSLVIVATLIMIISFTQSCESQDKVSAMKKNKQTVKNWDKPQEESDSPIRINGMYSNAASFKKHLLSNYDDDVREAKSKAADLQYSADTATVQSAKEEYLKQADAFNTEIKELNAKSEELKAMDDKALKKMALKMAKEGLSNMRSGRNRSIRTTIFYIILVVLYFFSQRPYGYTITRHRLENKILGGIQRFFSRFAFGAISLSAMVGSMKDRSTVTHWTDGTSTENHDYGATAVNSGLSIIKLIPFVIGIVILYIGSFLFMIYYTIQGLRRNYTRENIVDEFKLWCGLK